MNLQNQTPIILCHTACSGGSMIYRMIIASFGLEGISEISHRFPFEDDAFIPTDPERALLTNHQEIAPEFEGIFFNRILNANAICERNGRNLLIREHSHSYFFLNQPPPESPSWIADQYLNQLEEKVKCIVTVRDPVDSWLSLVANFPQLAPKTFDQYCSLYKIFVDSFVGKDTKQPLLYLKFEDIVEEPKLELQRISEFIGQPLARDFQDTWTQVSSTGNSGRRFSKVQRPPRRAYGTQLIIDSEKSDSYLYLTKTLNYPHLSRSITTRKKLLAYFVDMRRKFASALLFVLDKAQNWALRCSRIP